MLIIKIAANQETIHTIMVQRISGDTKGWCNYAFKKPSLPDLVLSHYYPDGALYLAAQALTLLAREGGVILSDTFGVTMHEEKTDD